MKLKKLLEKIDYTLLKGNEEIEVCDLGYDSRSISNGYAFVCLVGNNADGHNYIESAIENGANVIIVSKDVEVSSDVTVVKVEDTNKLLSRLSLNLFDKVEELFVTFLNGVN